MKQESLPKRSKISTSQQSAHNVVLSTRPGNPNRSLPTFFLMPVDRFEIYEEESHPDNFIAQYGSEKEEAVKRQIVVFAVRALICTKISNRSSLLPLPLVDS